MLSRRVFATLALGLFLPGCPLTDHYYIERGTGTAGQGTLPDGSSGLGGTFLGAGGSDGVGGDTPNGDGGAGDVEGTGALPGDAGASFGTGGDTSLGGDTSAGGTGGTVEGTGGTLSVGGSDGTTGGSGGSPRGGDTGSGGSFGGRTGGGKGGRGSMGGDGPMGGAMTGGAPAGGSATGGAGPNGGMAGSTQYQPLCDDSVVKGSSCTRTSVQRCYRGCGPDAVGFKLETCMGSSYMEGDCQFPTSGDYSCYAVPAPYHLPAACPGTVPRASDACDVAECTPCFGGSTTSPQYQDSTGSQKTGYCVCNADRVWTCATSDASSSSWPCPGNAGCN